MTTGDWNVVREFERAYIARLDTVRSDEQALEIYEELWLRAKELGAVDLADVANCVESDIKMARTLNALR